MFFGRSDSDRRTQRRRSRRGVWTADRAEGDQCASSGIRCDAGEAHHRDHHRTRRVAAAIRERDRGCGAHMITRLIHAIWLGSGVFLVLAAQAAFRTASSPTAAAAFVGALLGRWHYIALAAPIALLALEWRRARTTILMIIFAGVLFAAAQVIVDLRIRSIRAKSPVPI